MKNKFSITKISRFVPMKQLNASDIEFTIGSPRTLKEVFTNTGQSVIFLNSLVNHNISYLCLHAQFVF